MQTTKKDFKRFRDEFNRWVQILGLNDYKIYFDHRRLDDVFANIVIDERGKVATVTMTKELSPVNAEVFFPEEHAKHEAIHLLLNKLFWLGTCRYVRDAELQDEWERLVRVLEKAL
jgi:hypothetical protein